MKTGSGGSAGWSNSVRSRLHLFYPEPESDAEPDRSARVLELPKANYGSTGESIRLRYVEGTLRPDVPPVWFVRHPDQKDRLEADQKE